MKIIESRSTRSETWGKLVFETEGNLKLIWQFIYLSFFDQDLMMLELKYQQHAEDFQRINVFHQEAGFIAKKHLKYTGCSNCFA